MQDFNNLRVYKDAKKFAVEIYKVTKSYPKSELFGLVNQMRTAALSIGANIAEGTGRMSDVDFRRFLFNAIGSAKEAEYYIDLSKELGYLDEREYKVQKGMVVDSSKMLNGLIQSLNT